MRIRGLDEHCDPQPVTPSALGQLPDVPFAAVEAPLMGTRLEQEALEVSECIEDEASDLTGLAGDAVRVARTSVSMLGPMSMTRAVPVTRTAGRREA
jgi:hypothetical protein